MDLEPMAIRYTSRKDLDRTVFRWLCACLVLWLVLVLHLAHQYPREGPILLFLLPTIAFLCVAMFPRTGFDFQGLVLAGSFFCCYLSPEIYKSLLENRMWELMAMAFYIVFAMGFGFIFFRLMGKAFQALS